jgi:Predicted AAA-ATPase
MQNLPVGEQSFKNIRERDLLYVDKTRLIHRLITGGSYYFFSRPRRFGKSLTLATIHEIFNGHRHLFEGLWIEDNWDWSQKNPVIHVSFNTASYITQPEDFRASYVRNIACLGMVCSGIFDSFFGILHFA